MMVSTRGLLAAGVMSSACVGVAQASLTVVGGPTFDGSAGYVGQRSPYTPGPIVAGGVAIGAAGRVDGQIVTQYGVRFGSAGTVQILEGVGGASSDALSLNRVGQVVGYSSSGDAGIARAARWDVGSSMPVLLGTLASEPADQASQASALNDNGLAAGVVQTTNDQGRIFQTATRWDSTGHATALPAPTQDASGRTDASASFITNSGIVIGGASAYDSAFNDVGYRAVRWDSSGVPEQLAALPPDENGIALSSASAVNSLGTVVGNSAKYGATDHEYLGVRPVRWDANASDIIELGVLNEDENHSGNATPNAINDAGLMVGWSDVYAANSDYLGARAVRWDLDSYVAIPLGELDEAGSITRNSMAYDVNAAGDAVGYIEVENAAGSDVSRAVVWSSDDEALDLNTLLAANTPWTLTSANGIDDAGWISGVGLFDPDGVGGQDAYQRLFLIQLPEPTLGTAMLGATMTMLLRRRAMRAA